MNIPAYIHLSLLEWEGLSHISHADPVRSGHITLLKLFRKFVQLFFTVKVVVNFKFHMDIEKLSGANRGLNPRPLLERPQVKLQGHQGFGFACNRNDQIAKMLLTLKTKLAAHTSLWKLT